MNFHESCFDRFVQVVVFNHERISVAFKYLTVTKANKAWRLVASEGDGTNYAIQVIRLIFSMVHVKHVNRHQIETNRNTMEDERLRQIQKKLMLKSIGRARISLLDSGFSLVDNNALQKANSLGLRFRRTT